MSWEYVSAGADRDMLVPRLVLMLIMIPFVLYLLTQIRFTNSHRSYMDENWLVVMLSRYRSYPVLAHNQWSACS
jgi:hypothetical protein